MSNQRRSIFRGLQLLALACTLSACDSPLSLESHPVGVLFLRPDGSEAASFEQGRSTTGQLVVPVGGTATYRMQLFDRAGNVSAVDGVEFSIRNPAVLIALAADVTLQGSDQIRLLGRRAQLTSLQFEVWHGTHQEFDVFSLPLQIQ